ncbi:MAG: Gfo/Idh/MocA family oxidoreductase [Armatimonadota bacterium]|nr:Gfo/Idh/MocA family oxidoreductase [Armatimonadota bacterium]
MTQEWQEKSALVVGFGSIGRRHARVLKEIGVRDVRVCETIDERRKAAQQELGIERVYATLEEGLAENPDTVFICSPTGEHIEQAIAAVQSGADVMIEKPLSTTLEGVDKLKTLASEHERVVMVAHCFRFHDGLLRAKKWLDAGRIGRLVAVRCLVGEYIPEVMPDYLNRYVSKYSGAYELMHDIDLALWLAGQKPKRVFGIDGTFSDVPMESPDLVEMLIEFQDRCAASVHLDFFQRARRRQTELFGTEGTIIVEFAKWDECTASIYEAKKSQWTHKQLKTDRDDMFRAEDRTFLEACVSRTPVPVDIDAGAQVVKVMLAAQHACKTGQAVEF